MSAVETFFISVYLAIDFSETKTYGKCFQYYDLDVTYFDITMHQALVDGLTRAYVMVMLMLTKAGFQRLGCS